MSDTNTDINQPALLDYMPTSEISSYDVHQQPQAGQPVWTHPSGPNMYSGHQMPYQPVPEAYGYWPESQGFNMPQQPPQQIENKASTWNEHNSNAMYYYQQSGAQPSESFQHQRTQYSQIDNENFSQNQPIVYNPNQVPAQYKQFPTTSNHSTNNTNDLVSNSTFPMWKNESFNISQPEQLPWTYGAPQYCPSEYYDGGGGGGDFNNTSNLSLKYSTDASAWTSQQDCPYSSSYSEQENIAVSNSSINLNNSEDSESVSSRERCLGDAESQSDAHLEANNICIGDLDTPENSVCDKSLDNVPSNFDNIPENSASASPLQTENVTVTEPPAQEIISDTQVIADDNDIPSDIGRNENFTCSIENDSDSFNKEEEEEKEKEINLESVQPKVADGFSSVVEDPFVNQEVLQSPEGNPVAETLSQPLTFQQSVTEQVNELSPEEPLNQQIPPEAPEISQLVSECEKLSISSRGESPCENQTVNITQTVEINKEIPVTEPKECQEKTIAQEVNLETFPDNWERPLDYEELRKQSPLYNSHKKYICNEVNSSPTSLLCDNPDIPCVTLAPAAPQPPVHHTHTPNKFELPVSNENVNATVAPQPPVHHPHKLNKFESPVGNENVVSTTTAQQPPVHHLQKPNKFELPLGSENISAVKMPIPVRVATADVLQKSNDNNLPSHPNGVQEKHAAELNDRRFSNENVVNRENDERYYKRESSYHPSLHDSRFADPNRSRRHEAPDHPSLRDSRIADPNYPRRHEAPDSLANTPYSERSNRSQMSQQTSHSESPVGKEKFNAPQKYMRYNEWDYYYSDRERSRPSSRTSMEGYENYHGAPPREARREYSKEYERPSSRMSESDASASDGRYGYYWGYPTQYPYPVYPRSGYDYDPYRQGGYYPYYDHYRYAYNYNYGFYDELYRNDPRYREYQEQYRNSRQYRELQEQYRNYHKYNYGTDYDQSSQSGRSSANEFAKESQSSRYREPDDSNESEYSIYQHRYKPYTSRDQDGYTSEAAGQVPTPSRLTPVKFSYSHPIVRFSQTAGMLVTAIPNQATSSYPPMIKVQNLQLLIEDDDTLNELKDHQGPLVRGSTHKNDVIEFCLKKINLFKEKEDVVDRESYILLYELMALLLRQNGSVSGCDIAELLLKDHDILHPPRSPVLKSTIETPFPSERSPADTNDTSSQSHAGDTSSPDEGIVVTSDRSSLNTSRLDPDKVTRKFREFLLFGHKKDALEWAVKHDLWGHALFLASKMDVRTYAHIMTRFANSLSLNDPLQTLYQLMSGRQPTAVTSVADKKWGDWRPHLAMILSNPSNHPDVDSRSITTLGDTLASQGCLPAAHFCYIMAQVEFGTYERKNSKIVLLSSDHQLPFKNFATSEAIQCTEIYEYAQSLANPNYMLVHLQAYKYLYAVRLLEYGFTEEALHYCEVIAGNIQAHPHLFDKELVSKIYKMAVELKYYDPHFIRGEGELEQQDDPQWITNLSQLVKDYDNILQTESLPVTEKQDISETLIESEADFSKQNQEIQNISVATSSGQSEMTSPVMYDTSYYQPSEWSQMSMIQSTPETQLSSTHIPQDDYYQNEAAGKPAAYQMESEISTQQNDIPEVSSSPVTQTSYDYFATSTQQVHTHESKQSSHDSSMHFSSSSNVDRRDSIRSTDSRYSASSVSVSNKSSTKENQKVEPKKDKPSSQAGKTWLGGIFSRLLPKAPNQMILPDDKNPTILWDPVKMRWINKENNNDDDDANVPAAPPTDSELQVSSVGTRNVEKPAQQFNNFQPPVAKKIPPSHTQANKFQRLKTRGMRNNYVDILNPSDGVNASMPSEALFPSPIGQSTTAKMFVPSPGNVTAENSTSPSETPSSHVGREEQHQSQNTAPLMFDPAAFESKPMGSQNRTLGHSTHKNYPT